MKILYLTDPFRDFLADQIYYGLCKLLEPARVIDYPYKAICHDREQKEWYLPQAPGARYEEADILDPLGGKEIDLVVLSWPSTLTRRPSRPWPPGRSFSPSSSSMVRITDRSAVTPFVPSDSAVSIAHCSPKVRRISAIFPTAGRPEPYACSQRYTSGL